MGVHVPGTSPSQASHCPVHAESQHSPTQPLPHFTVSTGGHAPLPSQLAASVATPAKQLGPRHETPDPGYSQVVRSVPSHAPPQIASPFTQGARLPTGVPVTG